MAIILMTKTAEEPVHTIDPKGCASEWLQDEITVEDVLDCMENYMKGEELKMQSQEP
jgi:hypothetical protein